MAYYPSLPQEGISFEIRDRRRWYHWLFEAKKRFGLQLLNFVVTSNHIHLLVVDSEPQTIAKSLQLIAGRTGQEFNKRKERKSAFWGDRYHATAVERDDHLIRCLVYIALNMVRAGVVSHQNEWEMNGYNDIQNPPDRYGVIDRLVLQKHCGYSDSTEFAKQHREWVQEAITEGRMQRENCWMESIAVGSKEFVEETRIKQGIFAKGKRTDEKLDGFCVLKEEGVSHNADFAHKNEALSAENAFFWDF